MAFDQSIADAVCERLAQGKSLMAACRELGVSDNTMRDWEKANPQFGVDSLRARELGAHALAEQCLEISNTPHMGVIKTVKPDGGIEERTEDMLGHRRLQIDTRLRLLGKWFPKLYGDKLAIGGADDLPPVRVEEVRRTIVDPKA